MPRPLRIEEPGTIYHVTNRGNGRMRLFHKDGDFAAFERVLAEGLDRFRVDLLTYCLMGNHWHLVLSPRANGALAALMGWVGVTHVRRHHAHYNTRGGGHLYQGRYKSFPVQCDRHRCWSCGTWRPTDCGPVSSPGRPTGRGAGSTPAPPVASRSRWPSGPSTARGTGRPSSTPRSTRRSWIAATARRLGLASTLRPIGRPRKVEQ
jgi:putative transposase